MAAVIGLTSLMLVIVSMVTTAFLGQNLENQLEQTLKNYADAVTRQLVSPLPQSAANLDNIVGGQSLKPGALLVGSSASGGTDGIVFEERQGQVGGSARYLAP